MEDRIIRLEETVALQDRTIEELSSMISAQQLELAELERQVALLGARLKGMSAQSCASGPADDDDPPPPHYG